MAVVVEFDTCAYDKHQSLVLVCYQTPLVGKSSSLTVKAKADKWRVTPA